MDTFANTTIRPIPLFWVNRDLTITKAALEFSATDDEFLGWFEVLSVHNFPLVFWVRMFVEMDEEMESAKLVKR